MRLLAFLLPVSAAAQIVCALGPGVSSYKPAEDQRPASDAMQLAVRVSTAEKAICGDRCPEIALFRNPTAPNAVLIVNPPQAKLVYAPQFFAGVYTSFGDAGIMAVIAHVAGHALDDTLGAAWIEKRWTPELRADAWAGCTLAKSNLSPAEVHSALGALEKYPSPKHPAWDLRLPVVRSGYTHCGGAASNLR